MDTRTIILCPNPDRDHGMKATKTAIQLLQELGHDLEHAREAGFGVLGLTYSPIRGPEGNIEYLGFLQKGAETTAAFDLDALVEESHQTLKEHGEGTV